jgi:DeoR family glycerol-3-phosphate regulon repressor
MSVEDLADKLQVSRETIRRDLSKLDAVGRLRKFHGGARSPSAPMEMTTEEGPFATRMAENADAKRKIAVAAARLLSPDDSVFIDTGTTTVTMADEMAKVGSLLIITNSPRIAATVSINGNKVFLIGGAYGADAGESLGPLALEQISKFRTRYAIITVGAIDGNTIMDYDLQEAEIGKAMIDRADKVIVLADHTKFEKRAVFEVTTLAAVDILVSDRPLPAHVAQALKNADVDVVIG